MRHPVAWLCCLLLAASAQAVELPRRWNFQVLLDGKPVGYHHFALREQGSQRTLTSSARFQVKVLFLNAYRYMHDATEQWQGDCLQGMNSQTDDNGKPYRVKAQRRAEELSIDGSPKAYTLPGCVMSFAYWNPAMLTQSRLLNAQTGEYDRVTITALGDTSIKLAGQLQSSRHYRLQGNQLNLELWYSLSGEWLALESTTESGSRLRYELAE